MDTLLLVGGSLLVLAGIVRWLRRHQREVDDLDQAEYRPPPVHGGAGPH